MKTVAIKITNPMAVARSFGECAGDIESNRPAWWVGSPRELYPADTVPDGAKIIHAPVRYCGGGAWIEHAPKVIAPDAARAMLADCRGSGVIYRTAKDFGIVEGKRLLRQITYLFGPVPLP